MATINLIPNGTISNSFSHSGIGLTHTFMDEDHSGTIATDSSYIHANTTGKKCVLNFQDFGEAYSSIDSVQAVVRSGNNGRGASFEIEVTILDGGGFGGTFWSSEGSGSQSGSLNYRTQTFTSRTTSNGSSAWTNLNLNNLRMEIELTAHSGGTTRLTYCYFIITYTEPVLTDNAIFFGSNF